MLLVADGFLTRARFRRLGGPKPQGVAVLVPRLVILPCFAFRAAFVIFLLSFPFAFWLLVFLLGIFRSSVLLLPYAVLESVHAWRVRSLALVAFHRQIPVVDKPPGSSFRDSTSARLTNVVLLCVPDIDCSDSWGPFVGPDRSSPEPGHQRSPKRRDGSRVSCGTESLSVGHFYAVPRDGVGSDQGFQVVREAAGFLRSREDFSFNRPEAVPCEELKVHYTLD